MRMITNTAQGPRGVLLTDGTTHYVEPGQSVELDVAEGHKLYEGLKSGKANDGADEPKALARMNKAELLEAAKAAGLETVKVDDADVPVADATNSALVAAIEAKRSEANA